LGSRVLSVLLETLRTHRQGRAAELDILDKAAETRILEAIDNGELDNLPGAGKPLDLSDDSGVPEELRLAYRVLKNAGFVPPEVTRRNEIADLQALLYDTDDLAERRRAARRLSLLMTELERSSGTRLAVDDEYYRKIVRKVT